MEKMADGTALKPVRCGCGGEAVIYVTHWWGKCYVCECEECGTALRPCTTESEAVTAWNRAMGKRTAKVVCRGTTMGLSFCCGNCGKPVHSEGEYCHHCGAKLDWSGDE